MRFSLRQLVTLVLLISLVLALWLSLTRIGRLENENLQLRDVIGFKRSYRDADYFHLSTTGYTDGGPDQTLIGSHLLRVENNEKYSLEVTFYDGATNNSVTQSVDINDPLVAITYIPRISDKNFFIQSTYFANQETRLLFPVDTHERLSFNPQGSNRQINEGCILVYFFYPPATTSSPNASETGDPLTRKRMFDLCDKYKIQTVFFRIVPRHGR